MVVVVGIVFWWVTASCGSFRPFSRWGMRRVGDSGGFPSSGQGAPLGAVDTEEEAEEEEEEGGGGRAPVVVVRDRTLDTAFVSAGRARPSVLFFLSRPSRLPFAASFCCFWYHNVDDTPEEEEEEAEEEKSSVSVHPHE